MKHLWIFRGLPGSGKSTLVREIFFRNLNLDQSWFEADMWMVDKNGNYLFDPTKLPYCHQMCQDSVRNSMEIGRTHIYVSNTFVKLAHITPYLDLARKYGYSHSITVCTYPGKSIHNVPDKTLNRMMAEWES